MDTHEENKNVLFTVIWINKQTKTNKRIYIYIYIL